jgi:hypothetical protein
LAYQQLFGLLQHRDGLTINLEHDISGLQSA